MSGLRASLSFKLKGEKSTTVSETVCFKSYNKVFIIPCIRLRAKSRQLIEVAKMYYKKVKLFPGKNQEVRIKLGLLLTSDLYTDMHHCMNLIILIFAIKT